MTNLSPCEQLTIDTINAMGSGLQSIKELRGIVGLSREDLDDVLLTLQSLWIVSLSRYPDPLTIDRENYVFGGFENQPFDQFSNLEIWFNGVAIRN